MDKDIVIKALEEYRNSPKYQEDIIKFEKQENILKSQRERFHNLSKEDRAKFIRACIKKYESDEYRDKEYLLKYEPRTPLYTFLFEYASEYGNMSYYNMNRFFPEDQYEIDGKFIIGMMYGQGVHTYCIEVADNELIPHDTAIFPEIRVYNPSNKQICTTGNFSIFIDICRQIKEKSIKGYTFNINDGARYIINTDGTFDINAFNIKK